MSVLILAAKQPPNLEALALGPTIGWLVFVCVLALVAIIVLIPGSSNKGAWGVF